MWPDGWMDEPSQEAPMARTIAEVDLPNVYDTVLPAQVSGPSWIVKRGERQLLVAVLQDAVDCFRTHAFASDQRRQRLALEAEEWIARDDPASPFSFVSICDHLGLDPDSVREKLWDWRERHAVRHHGREAASPAHRQHDVRAVAHRQ
jgi:hypothetical protein